MESVGTILKSVREAKGYSVEQVARETNIVRRYITALEAEDVSAFPGETYFIGFLRNYAEFLGEDPERLISLFKNLQIQEQAPPMEELLQPRRSIKVPLIIGLAVLLAVIVGVVWFVVLPRAGGDPGTRSAESSGETAGTPVPGTAAVVPPPAVSASGAGAIYEFTDEVLERSFSLGDTINVHLGGTRYPLKIDSAGDAVKFALAQGDLELPLGAVTALDLNGDGVNDLKVVPRQITADGSGVVLYLDKYVESVDPLILAMETPNSVPGDGTGTSGVSPGTPGTSPGPGSSPAAGATTAILGQAGSASRAVREQIIMEAPQPRAFDVDVVFRGLCLVRYITDNNLREERYFHQGDVLKIEASRELRLWISNAGSFTGRVGGTSLSLGNPGEVSTRLIRWERNDSNGQYQLKLIPVY